MGRFHHLSEGGTLGKIWTSAELAGLCRQAENRAHSNAHCICCCNPSHNPTTTLVSRRRRRRVGSIDAYTNETQPERTRQALAHARAG